MGLPSGAISPSPLSSSISARASAAVLPPLPKAPCSFQRESDFAGHTSQTTIETTGSNMPVASPTFSPYPLRPDR